MIHDPQAISRQYLAARYDNRPVSHRLKTEPYRLFGISGWVWKASAALAFLCWISLKIQGL